MKVEVKGDKVMLELSRAEADSIRRQLATGTPRDTSKAGLDQWHQDAKATGSLVLRLAALLDGYQTG